MLIFFLPLAWPNVLKASHSKKVYNPLTALFFLRLGFNFPFQEFSCLSVFLLSEMSVLLALRTVSQPLTHHTVLDASSSSESAQTSVSSHHFPSFLHSKMLSFHHICCLWVHNTDWLLAKQCISFLTCKWDNISGMMENIDRKARMWSLN